MTKKQKHAIKTELLGEICILVHNNLTLRELEKAVNKLCNDLLPNCCAITKNAVWDLAYYTQHHYIATKSVECYLKRYFKKNDILQQKNEHSETLKINAS